MLYLLDYTKGETGKTCILKERDSSKNYVFFSSSLVKEIINVSKESIQEYKETIK
jgi:hypothetical protein